MPKAISHLGLIPGVIGIFIFGMLFTYCIHILFQVNRAIVNRVTLDRRQRDLQLQRSNALKQPASFSSGTIKVTKTNISSEEWEIESYSSCYETVPDDFNPPYNNPQINENNSTQQTEQPNIEENNEASTHPELIPVRTLPYHNLIPLSFHYGNKNWKWIGKPLKRLVLLFINLTHYGCCCVCFLFIAESLGELVTKGPFTHSNSFEMVAYAIPLVICFSLLPAGYEMTAVNALGCVMQFVGVVMMSYYFVIGEHCNQTDFYSASSKTWYLYFGLIFYAFEGMSVCLHVENSMARKEGFLGWNGILNISMCVTILVYAIIGGLGYWKYGNGVYTSVNFNLPEERFPDQIQMLLGMGVLLTYPFHFSFILNSLRNYALKILCFDESFLETDRYYIFDIILRAVIVVSTYVISSLVPYLELQLTVLGATVSCLLVLCMPPLMSLNNHNLPGLNYGMFRRGFHIVIFLIGMAGIFLGTTMTIMNAYFNNPNSTVH